MQVPHAHSLTAYPYLNLMVNHSGHTVRASICWTGLLTRSCLPLHTEGQTSWNRQKVARLREHNNNSNNNLKYKLPIERKPPEPVSTAATTETRTNVKIRKLCSPDMLSDSRTAPRFCIRINKLQKSHTTNKGQINSANVTPRQH